MFDVSAFLDRAKAAAGDCTDYRLSKLLGVTTQAVSNWRAGRTAPDERAIVKLCELTGDDAALVAATLQAERARTDEAAALWRQIADRLSSVDAAKIAVALAIVFAAQMLGGTDSFATIGLAAALDGFSTHRI